MNGSRTLGNQRRGFNSCYFWQHNRSHDIQTYGEKVEQVSPLRDGDIIGIRVDFDRQMIYYYKNQHLEGVVSCTKRKIEEGRVFPCVGLSIGAHIRIMNVEKCPPFLQEYLT